jgi:hypothetical protein
MGGGGARIGGIGGFLRVEISLIDITGEGPFSFF